MYIHTQKSGTAILLFRILRLWYCLFTQTATLKPTPYAPMRALCAYINYIPMGILCCNVLDACEFTRFQIAKTKRVRRLFQYVLYLPPPERHIPSARAKYRKTFLATRAGFILRCKITTNIWLTQINCYFFLWTPLFLHIRCTTRLFDYAKNDAKVQ